MPGLLILFLVTLPVVLMVGVGIVVYTLRHPPRRTAATQVASGLPTDPDDLKLTWHTDGLRLEDGTEIELWLVEGLNAGGPTVVMLHGWGDSRLGALRWLETLLPTAGRVVLFDQRAHGESACRNCQWGSAECRDAAAVIDHLHTHHAPSSVVLFGYSMGAAVAIETAMHHEPERVAAVIADSPYRYAEDAVRRIMRLNHLPSWPLLNLATPTMRLLCPAFGEADTARAAAHLRQPLLLIHGADDRIVPLAHASAITDAAPTATLEVFVGADHLQAACLEPHRYTAAVRRFLGQTLPESHRKLHA